MFALSSQPSYHAFQLTPHMPLSPLNPSASAFNAQCNTPYKRTDATSSLKKPGLFKSSRVSQRPSLARHDPLKERAKRRSQFLSRIKEKGDEKRFEARNEQLQRLDAIAERKAWIEERQREAVQWAVDPEDVEKLQEEDFMVEDFAAQEKEEIEAFMSSMSISHSSREQPLDDRDMSTYGSDDEEYDMLMMQALEEAEKQHSVVQPSHPDESGGDMDVSMG